MSDVIDPIIPRRWIPPFFREQAVAEEVQPVKVRVAGTYTSPLFEGAEFLFRDKDREYLVRFQGGTIYLIQQ